MGYYSNVEQDILIKEDKVKELKDTIQAVEDSGSSLDWQCNLLGAMVEEYNGHWYLEYKEPFAKHYETDQFCIWLRDKVHRGSIMYRGEDGTNWGYHFDGQGKVHELVWTVTLGVELGT